MHRVDEEPEILFFNIGTSRSCLVYVAVKLFLSITVQSFYDDTFLPCRLARGTIALVGVISVLKTLQT